MPPTKPHTPNKNTKTGPTSNVPNAETSTLSHSDRALAWRPLHYLNLYRITLAALFVSAIFVTANLPLLGETNPVLFQNVSFIYLGVALLASFAIRLRWADFRVFTYGLVVFDILSLTLIMRARSEEHTSELQSRGLISYAVFCLKKKK